MIGDSILGPIFGGRSAARWGANNQLRLPREGLLLYLGRPNLEAADVPLGDDTELGDDTIIRWMFLLPADADIRAATGWVSGVGNIFYDAAGDPVAVLASEIADWASINQWNVLFHLVSAYTETGRLAIYSQYTPLAILNKALKVLLEDQIDVSPSAFFNGMYFRLLSPAYLGGPIYVPDHIGVLRSPGANLPAVQGMRLATTVADGAVLGAELIPSLDLRLGSTVNTSSVGVNNFTTTANGGVFNLGNLSIGKKFKIAFNRFTTASGGCDLFSHALGSTVIDLKLTNGPGTYTVDISRPYLYVRNLGAGDTTGISISIKEVIPAYFNTDESGNAILPSAPQKTVTYNTDWTAKTFAETFDKFDSSDPLKAPGWLCEPVRTNYALNSATPATHTTGTIAVGTYTLWQEGTGSIVATAGTAVGTFGTASNGAPATITITIAGTVVLTASGTNTWVQLELGAFKTSRIYTTTAPVTRAATIASFPTAGKIPVNNFAIRMIAVPRASGQNGVSCFGSYVDSNNFIVIIVNHANITIRKRIAGINTDALVLVTHVSGAPLDLILYSSPNLGMQIAVRAFSSLWGTFTDGTANDTADAKANAPIASTYQLGALNGSSQFTGNISLFDCVPIPSGITDPMAWAKTHWGVA